MDSAADRRPAKRKMEMKTPFQLEILEIAFAEVQKPSAEQRAELSARTGLSHQQIQMWFYHRRKTERSVLLGSRITQLRSGPGPCKKRRGVESLRGLAVEFREDGPDFGALFDPVPPGAFGAPIVTEQYNQPLRTNGHKLYQRHEAKSVKAEKLTRKEVRKEKEAVRFKDANESSMARRSAKESMDLIDDEHLELMELAATNNELSSITSLDREALQQLDLFRDKLSTFPPKSVQLVQPFATHSWSYSEENIGNLLMVWKFLVTFVDVLGLKPFNLDKFVQALHNHDSRLLGEIHVALMKSIIKDMEDAKTAVTLGAKRNSVAYPVGGVGGHPKIVEGAYSRGFDICSWQHQLNSSTWPDILRQLVSSAPFGKKRNVKHTIFCDDNEGSDAFNVIASLRNGAAAEAAVALMHRRGCLRQNRFHQNRLTPGTIKFASFHILSLEGSKGLTTSEIANKIQKSGLKDLATNKAPESSITTAMLRDTKLFARIAPSTYCVRAPFRKDPEDADAILSAALEKVQRTNGLSDDGEHTFAAARVDDCECDAVDDPKADDVGAGAKLTMTLHSNESKDSRASNSLEVDSLSDMVGITTKIRLRNVENRSPTLPSEDSKALSILGASPSLNADSDFGNARDADIEDTEMDGEPWVQGLIEGEYSDLSVDKRICALVFLTNEAIEGNSIHGILEERLKSATIMKKQMWAKTKFENKCFRDDCTGKFEYPSLVEYKVEPTPTNAVAEGSQSPQHRVANKGGNLNFVNDDQCLEPNQNSNSASLERNLLGQEFSANADSVSVQQYTCASNKSKSQLKCNTDHKDEEFYIYRSLPLGEDRRRNRYWLFSTFSQNDPGSGRIFFESVDGFWRLIDSEEAFESLLAALDKRGIRESNLHSRLQRVETTFKEAVRRRKSSWIEQ